MARRKEELTRIASQIQASTEIMHLDLESVDAAKEYRIFLERFSTIDTVIYCAGFGEINPELDWKFCQKTLTVNVMAFTQITNISYLVMKQQGCGKFVAISSIGGIRGAENDSGYSASKSYIIKYIEGMARKSNKEGKHVSFLTVLPGFVDTQMAKGDHFFWMCTPQIAAQQIICGIQSGKRYLYVTKRWRLIAWLLSLIPSFFYERM